MELQKHKKSLRAIGILILNHFFHDFIISILIAYGIDLTNYTINQKMLILFVLDIILAIILFKLYKKEIIDEFNEFKLNFKEQIKKYFKFWLLGMLLMSVSSFIISAFTTSDIPVNEEIIREIILKYPLYSLLSTAFMAPFIEEIIYRKTIRKIINNKKLFIFISGLAFGVAHVIYSVSNITDFLHIIPYGLFGSVFAYMYVDSESIYVPIFFHFLHNTILVLFQIFMGII